MTLLVRCRCQPLRVKPYFDPVFIDAQRRMDDDTVLDAARRWDPTGTAGLRRQFRLDMDRHWERFRRTIIGLIDRNDTLGVGQKLQHQINVFPVGSDRVKTFQKLVDEGLKQIVLQTTGQWMVPYLTRMADAARARADKLTGKTSTVNADRFKVLASSSITELEGVMEAVSQQAVRAFSAGLLSDQPPSRIARSVSAVVISVGRARGRMVAQHQAMKTFASSTLDAFRQAGISSVGVDAERLRVVKSSHGLTKADSIVRLSDAPRVRAQPRGQAGKFRRAANPVSAKEFDKITQREAKLAELGEVDVLTAGDDDVCPTCEDISDSGPYDLDTAESLIPAHINCRCAFVPTDDERFAEVESSDAFDPSQARDDHGRWTAAISAHLHEHENLHATLGNGEHVGTYLGRVQSNSRGFRRRGHMRQHFVHNGKNVPEAKVTALIKQHGIGPIHANYFEGEWKPGLEPNKKFY